MSEKDGFRGLYLDITTLWEAAPRSSRVARKRTTGWLNPILTPPSPTVAVGVLLSVLQVKGAIAGASARELSVSHDDDAELPCRDLSRHRL